MNREEKPGYRYSCGDTIITAGIVAFISALKRQIGKEASNRNDSAANEQALVKYTRRLTCATWVIAFAAFLSFGAALLQWDALYNTDKTTRAALVEVQRAFVFKKAFEVDLVNTDFSILPQWENSGATPANKRTTWVSWKPFAGGPPSDFYLMDLDANGNPVSADTPRPESFLGPHSTEFATALIIPGLEIKEARLGHKRLFIWGWTEYRDAFDGTPIHRTEFCNEVIVTSLGDNLVTNLTTVALRFPQYGPYNTAK